MDDVTIEELTAAEHQWLQALQGGLVQMGVKDAATLCAVFLEAREAWWDLPAAERPDPNPTINAFGAGIGQLFVDDLGLRWALVTDQYGSELGVVGDPSLVLYPTNAVAKRWSGENQSTLEDYLGQVSDTVRDLQARRPGQ
jgi:hypothetical protein